MTERRERPSGTRNAFPVASHGRLLKRNVKKMGEAKILCSHKEKGASCINSAGCVEGSQLSCM